MPDVHLDLADGVATVTLDRPDSLNAFTDDMEQGLVEIFEHCDAEDDVRAVILTGAGRAFCAGADLSDGSFDQWRRRAESGGSESLGAGPDGLPVRRDGGGRVTLSMLTCRKPIIAAINGHAVGVGATMTLAADFRMMADRAKIGFVFNRRGLVPESCSTWLLPRLVGVQPALEWLITGRIIESAEAERTGLVRSVSPDPEALMSAAAELAHVIASASAPVSVALTKQLVNRMLGASDPFTAHVAESVAFNLRGVSNDAEEGIKAFFDKRSPRFEGRVSVEGAAVWDAVDSFLAGKGFD